jgi:hypothetical protein
MSDSKYKSTGGMRSAMRAKGVGAGDSVTAKLDPGAVPRGAWERDLPPLPCNVAKDPDSGEERSVRPSLAAVPVELENAALADFAQGMSQVDVERKYSLSGGYVRHALTRRFGSNENYKRALSGLLLELGIACAEHTLINIDALHPSQSGMLTSVMTNAAIALEKHQRDVPRAVDFGALERIGEALERMEKYAGVAKVVDVDSD